MNFMQKGIVTEFFVTFLSSWALAQKDIVCQLIQSSSYTCEKHEIHTKDNYTITVHRIPPLKASNITQVGSHIKRPVMLMHGLIGSAADYVLPAKNNCLSFMFHERGYDVWLPNARGTTSSKKHKFYDPSQAAFWNFSWHEIGVEDLPATVDYILHFTKQTSLHYVAHSQGSTTLFVLLSEKPEYNEKIVSAHLLAPVAFLADLQSPLLRIMAQRSNEIGHLLPRMFEMTPAGISRKQFQHFGQLITSGKFQQFDYNSKSENYLHYKRKTPPEYNLRNVRVPLQLFYGNRDLLMVKKDVFRLTEKLGNTIYSLNEIRGFNHIDLLYSTAAPRLIFKNILKEIHKFYN